MHAEVVHHIPGRIRLRVPELRDCGDLSRWLKGPVLSELGIESFRVNQWCASVVITYNAAIPGVVNRLLASLQFFTIPADHAPDPAAPVPIVSTIKSVVRRVN